MPRLPELDSDSASPLVQRMLDAQAEAFGFALNSTRVMGHCPDIARAQGVMGDAIDQAGNIECRLRYLLYSKVASMNGCPF